jgi:4-hydroxy-tetrahydrodipicolinate synthase
MPYGDDLSIDYDALQREVDYLFDVGADGCSLALVSDLLRLTTAERCELPRRLVDFAAGRGPVIISVGAESTPMARAYARAAEDGGAGAIMAIPPISQAMSEAQLHDYFGTLLQEVSLPLLVQDASSYVGRSMSLDFQARLFSEAPDRIMFKPEATPLGPCISALRQKTDGRAAIFEGSGGILLVDAYRRGIAGTIPGVDLLDGVVGLWRALQAGDEARTYALYLPICALVALQLQGGLDGFIVAERHLMLRRGIFARLQHRGPMAYALDTDTQAEVHRLFDLLQAALRS